MLEVMAAPSFSNRPRPGPDDRELAPVAVGKLLLALAGATTRGVVELPDTRSEPSQFARV